MDVFVEQIVEMKRTPKQTALKALIVIVAGLIIFACVFAGFVFANLAPILWIAALSAGYGTVRLASMFDIEYEYCITNGQIDIDKITARRSRKRCFTCECKDIIDFGRYDENSARLVGQCDCEIIAGNPEDAYYFIVPHKTYGKTFVMLQPNEKMLKSLNIFIPRRVRRGE